MTTLPTVIQLDEMAAFKFTCRVLQPLRDGNSPWGNSSVFDPRTGSAFWREHLHMALRWPLVKTRLQVIAVARAGDEDAIAVVNDFITELKSASVPLPTEFQAFSMDMLNGLIAPLRYRGPKVKRRFLRDLFIAYVVAAVVDKFGIPYSRMRKTRDGRRASRRSASAIVAAALREVMPEIQIGEAGIERIYEKRLGAMPTMEGWTRDLEP